MKTVIIMGRPNVGKSTLFNRLVGRQKAIVHDRPGVTRDWQICAGKIADLHFNIVDTPGLEGFETDDLKTQIHQKTKDLIEKCDLILFMVDGRDGLLPIDETLAEWARKSSKPVILLCNKTEGFKGDDGLYSSAKLGLGDPIALSAAHGLGLDSLYDRMSPYLVDPEDTQEDLSDHIDDDSGDDNRQDQRPLRLAILGRPNVGKSTLINKLIRDDRLITSDQPGVTRDSVEIEWSFAGRPIILMDTAGIRKKARISDSLETASIKHSFEAVKYAHVVILVLDALSPLDKQDLLLASHVIGEGRALILAVNKWDKANEVQLDALQESLHHLLSQVKGIPVVPISALYGKNLNKMMSESIRIYDLWNYRIPTSKLNMFLEAAVERHPPKFSGPGRIRLKYITQIKSRPPTFALFASKPSELPESYIRYLTDGIRKEFDLWGVPIRMYLKKGKNPYVKS